MSQYARLPILDLALEIKTSMENRIQKDNQEISSEEYIIRNRFSLTNLACIAVKSAFLLGSFSYASGGVVDKHAFISLGIVYGMTMIAQFKKEPILKREAFDSKLVQNLILENFSRSNFSNFNNLAVESTYRFSLLVNNLLEGGMVNGVFEKAHSFVQTFKESLNNTGLKLFKSVNKLITSKLNKPVNFLTELENAFTSNVNKDDLKRSLKDFLKDASNPENALNKKYVYYYSAAKNPNRNHKTQDQTHIKNVNEDAIVEAYKAITKQNINLLFARLMHDHGQGKKNENLLEYFVRLNSYTSIPQKSTKMPPLPIDPSLSNPVVTDLEQKEYQKELKYYYKTIEFIKKESAPYKEISEIALAVQQDSYKGSFDFKAVLKEIDPDMVSGNKIKVFSFESAFNSAKETKFKRELGKEGIRLNSSSLINKNRLEFDEIDYKTIDLNRVAKIEKNKSIERHLRKEDKRNA